MVQEYLFIDTTQREQVENYKPENVNMEIHPVDNSDCWTVRYEVEGENEHAAKLLSDVNTYILKNFDATVLSNGSSAYFNKSLFPHINEFERKLRKLLYLKSALNKDDKAVENIKDLEKKDLGTIFELLFSDENFVKKSKLIVNKELTWQFTKKELISLIEETSEETLWKHLIGEDAVPSLRDGFYDVRSFRNDVMHAHNIDIVLFREAKRLFEKINKELDIEIESITHVNNKPEEDKDTKYNEKLSAAIANMNSVLTTALNPEALNSIDKYLVPNDSLLNANYASNLNIAGLQTGVEVASTLLAKDNANLSILANNVKPLGELDYGHIAAKAIPDKIDLLKGAVHDDLIAKVSKLPIDAKYEIPVINEKYISVDALKKAEMIEMDKLQMLPVNSILVKKEDEK